MSSKNADITRDERDAIRRHVLVHVESIDDLRFELGAGEYEKADRLTPVFADELRLMEDLGWSPNTQRTSFRLTMPQEQRLRIFRRLRDDLDRLRVLEEEEEQKDREAARPFQERSGQIAAVCSRLLGRALISDDSKRAGEH